MRQLSGGYVKVLLPAIEDINLIYIELLKILGDIETKIDIRH
jgi:hypothetical protein